MAPHLSIHLTWWSPADLAWHAAGLAWQLACLAVLAAALRLQVVRSRRAVRGVVAAAVSSVLLIGSAQRTTPTRHTLLGRISSWLATTPTSQWGIANASAACLAAFAALHVALLQPVPAARQ